MIQISKMLILESRYSIKSPYPMNPKGVIIHNTAGYADAISEAKYMSSNNKYSSMHFYVDESRIIQTLPFNRNAWHATDGSNGYANRNLIGVEVCRSMSDLDVFLRAEENACELAAYLLNQLGLQANENTIRFHNEFYNTECPHRTKQLGGKSRIIDKVKRHMENVPDAAPFKVYEQTNAFSTETAAARYAAERKKAGKKVKVFKE